MPQSRPCERPAIISHAAKRASIASSGRVDAISANANVTCELEKAITTIETLDLAGCLNRWRDVFERPPKHLSTRFIKRVLIRDVQGGVSRATERHLRHHRRQGAAPEGQDGNASERTCQVEVVEDGYRMDGRTWRSLSAIARHITGAQ
ncbi:MAG: DUF2924 domain-containing protein [Rhodospirillales bacterium]|nr:DUF2924 domain-containing protein [Rhodospirillales bacterium]